MKRIKTNFQNCPGTMEEEISLHRAHGTRKGKPEDKRFPSFLSLSVKSLSPLSASFFFCIPSKTSKTSIKEHETTPEIETAPAWRVGPRCNWPIGGEISIGKEESEVRWVDCERWRRTSEERRTGAACSGSGGRRRGAEEEKRWRHQFTSRPYSRHRRHRLGRNRVQKKEGQEEAQGGGIRHWRTRGEGRWSPPRRRGYGTGRRSYYWSGIWICAYWQKKQRRKRRSI